MFTERFPGTKSAPATLSSLNKFPHNTEVQIPQYSLPNWDEAETSQYIAQSLQMAEVSVDSERVSLVNDSVALIDCTDGKFFEYRDLARLEDCLGLPVVVCGRTHVELPGQPDGHGWTLLVDCRAEQIVTDTMFSNSANPKRDASIAARRQYRYYGPSAGMLASEIDVFEIDPLSGARVETTATLLEYLTNPNLHTPGSYAWVVSAKPPQSLVSKGKAPARIIPGIPPAVPLNIPLPQRQLVGGK